MRMKGKTSEIKKGRELIVDIIKKAQEFNELDFVGMHLSETIIIPFKNGLDVLDQEIKYRNKKAAIDIVEKRRVGSSYDEKEV